MYKKGSRGHLKLSHQIAMVPSRTLPDADKLLLMEIGNAQRMNGWCTKSNKTMAINLGWSGQKVSRTVSRLTERGFLDVDGDTTKRQLRVRTKGLELA